MFGELAALEAAPPHAARPDRGRRSEPDEAARRAAGRRWRRGSGCWPGPRPTTARSSAAPATRSTSPRRRAADSVPWEQVEAADWDSDAADAAGQRGRHLGRAAARAPLRARPSPAGCSSWSASGSPPASCSSGTSPVAGRRGVRVIARRAPRGDRPRAAGSTSTTRASTPTTRSSEPRPRRRSPRPATRSTPAELGPTGRAGPHRRRGRRRGCPMFGRRRRVAVKVAPSG